MIKNLTLTLIVVLLICYQSFASAISLEIGGFILNDRVVQMEELFDLSKTNTDKYFSPGEIHALLPFLKKHINGELVVVTKHSACPMMPGGEAPCFSKNHTSKYQIEKGIVRLEEYYDGPDGDNHWKYIKTFDGDMVSEKAHYNTKTNPYYEEPNLARDGIQLMIGKEEYLKPRDGYILKYEDIYISEKYGQKNLLEKREYNKKMNGKQFLNKKEVYKNSRKIINSDLDELIIYPDDSEGGNYEDFTNDGIGDSRYERKFTGNAISYLNNGTLYMRRLKDGRRENQLMCDKRYNLKSYKNEESSNWEEHWNCKKFTTSINCLDIMGGKININKKCSITK